MKRHVVLAWAVLAALAAGSATAAKPAASKRTGAHAFAVIGHTFPNGAGDAPLRDAIAEASDPSLAFVVATGIKSASESCSDKLYLERRALFDDAPRPTIVNLAASDWGACRNPAGRSAAIERLNRLRELLFAEPASLGTPGLALTRMSANAKFRSYAENATWEVGKVLYATINLPANNNHYLPEAGRNSEFEDRLVANRAWLQRLFGVARRKKLDGIVLFSDGDPGVMTVAEGFGALFAREPRKDDGFAGPRKQIFSMAKKFAGKVLLIDAQAPAEKAEPALAIEWRNNIGHLNLGSHWVHVKVTPGTPAVFELVK